MNRRIMFGLIASAAGMMSVTRRSAAAVTSGKTAHAIVIHVTANDPEVMNLALNNAANVVRYYGDKGDETAVEIVANGPGLHMFRDDTSPVKGRLLAFSARMPQVVFSACENTRQAMASAEGKEIPLVAQAKSVPSGVVRLMELQEQGWSYVRS